MHDDWSVGLDGRDYDFQDRHSAKVAVYVCAMSDSIWHHRRRIRSDADAGRAGANEQRGL